MSQDPTQDKSSQLVHKPSCLLAERPTERNISEASSYPVPNRTSEMNSAQELYNEGLN